MSYLPLALFSRVVKPGQPLELEEDDLIKTVTNVTFGENVKGKGRSCLKIQFNDIAGPDDAVDDLADVSADVSTSKAETKSKGKGKTAPAAEDEDEDDDSEDDGSMLDFIVRETVLATLIPEKIENASLNIMLFGNETYKVMVTGENDVHISGQYISLPNNDDEDSSDYDEEDMYDEDGLLIPTDEDEALEAEFGQYDPEVGLLGGELTGLVAMGSSDEDEEDSDEEGVADDSARFEELEPSPKKAKGGKKASKADDNDVDMAEAVSKASKADTSVTSKADTSVDGLSKNQRKKLAKQLAKQNASGAGEVTAVNGTKTENVSVAKDGKKTVEVKSKADVTVKQANGAEAKETAKKASKKITLPSGLSYSEPKTGKGPQVKAGQKVEIRYVGKLENGKIFDSNTKGKAFSFAVGKSEVIKGMDEGIIGMAPGGERKLHIPAKLGYGKSGNGDIPSNANLTFDIKLISVK